MSTGFDEEVEDEDEDDDEDDEEDDNESSTFSSGSLKKDKSQSVLYTKMFEDDDDDEDGFEDVEVDDVDVLAMGRKLGGGKVLVTLFTTMFFSFFTSSKANAVCARHVFLEMPEIRMFWAIPKLIFGVLWFWIFFYIFNIFNKINKEILNK